MSKKEFTVARAIEIQTEQLADWKKLLKFEVYSALETWATQKNHLKETGDQVIRGSDLNHFIANYNNGYRPPN